MAPLPTPQLTTDILDSVNSSDITPSSSITYDSTLINPHIKFRFGYTGVIAIFASGIRAYVKVCMRNTAADQPPHTQGQNQALSRTPNSSPKERKVLTEEELTIYSVIEYTEKMTGAYKDSRYTTPKNGKPIDNEPSTKKLENEINYSKENPKIIKSDSNILSNVLQQEKSIIFDPSSKNSNLIESNQNNSEYSECLICFETINVGDNIRLIPCLHRFHKECLDNWLTSRSGSCPNCRYDLRPLGEASIENSPGIEISTLYNNVRSSSNPNRYPVIQYQNILNF
ncbi:Receptor homology region, transmembrane domain- and RING domain-containing protein 2 [Smittium culicis]|uniref:RING-type E3 ubiquitin transferase n=1 Tax=Smittium culicis TaxID=133412 RepID=A0A1R1X2Y9_9FUNG|nr:Receptor homology region, transmembrane domain- and RING domain-containing protein 2 [Smittium culicis]OMJ08980.1 Receptor homology region, transmembrane domain- and RING domain-containing protein 2 [Smittium culicis]OMJ15046.1 Receptor homology region, transmembrane domain- and RING domain-containing protein 2 [Smittium culicis]